MISAVFPYQKKRKTILGVEMAYVDEDRGDPIVFLHGNPNSSYMWRNILPHLQGLGRIVAPDLIGMGDSQKLPNSGPGSYMFAEHRRFLDALLETLDVRERVTFVVHDWGSVLSFDWASRHPDSVKGIAYMAAIVKSGAWSQMPEAARPIFQSLRSAAGEQMVLLDNAFLSFSITHTTLRPLTEEEVNEYRRPFAEPGEGRRPILSWARQLPLDGEPAEVNKIVEANAEWLSQGLVPKLFIQANPGVLQPAQLAFCQSLPAQTTVIVPGAHDVQEDSPDEIGQAIASWLRHLK